MNLAFITSAVLLAFLASTDAARILVYFPLMSKSHNILGNGVVRHLLNAGHEVVHITSFPKQNPVKNLKEIDVSSVANIFDDKNAAEAFKLKNLIGKEKLGSSMFFLLIAMQINERVANYPEIVKLMSDPKEKFDAVVLEWFFSDVASGIANLFECPLIWFSPTEANWLVLRLVDGIPNPAYTADIFSDDTLPLDFLGRVNQLWELTKKLAFSEFYVRYQESALYDRIFAKPAASRGVTLPSFKESAYNGSFMFINSHPSYGTPFVLPQNAKYIGGYHVEDDVPPLPEDLQKLMDNSKHGVIYFSMGSNLKSDDMTDEMKASILKMFENVKQDVLWKFEGELKGVPKNVKLLKWAPQQSILAHRNLKVFITHGGQLSTTEAVHHGVPLIGIPVLGDQHLNMKGVVQKGFGIMVTIGEDLAQLMKVAIDEVLRNPGYAQKAKEISMKYHHRITKPGLELAHWVDHVIRTGGAPHLRSYAVMTPWYQKMFLDLLALVIAVFVVLYWLFRMIVRSCTKKVDKKVKKN